MKKRMKTKGSAHLEMVTAFTLFIVFTIFLLYYIKAPGEDRVISEAILNKLESSFLNQTTTEMVSLVVKPNNTYDCVKFNLSNFSSISGNSSAVILRDVKLEWVGGGATMTITDDGKRGSSFDGSTKMLTLNASGINFSKNESVQIYLSNAISGGSTCSPANLSSGVGTIKREKVLSEAKVVIFNQNYSNNYSVLKTVLGLPSNVDFSVVSGNFLNASGNNPPVNIKSKRIVADVLLADGTLTKKNIDLSVW